MKTSEVGALSLPIGQYNVNIDAVISLTLPTTAQLSPTAAGATRKPTSGTMQCVLSIETQNARITLDGSTPSTTNGILLTAPGVLVLRGQNAIKALKIIGTAAGGVINYGFTVDEPQ